MSGSKEVPSSRDSMPVLPVSTRVAASSSSVKESNLALVASEIFSSGGGLSRADVAARTGLTRATVSRLVRELLDHNIVVEALPPDAGVAGRPATPLYPAAHTMVGIGIEVNADRMSGCAVDLTGRTIESFAREMDLINSEPGVVLPMLAEEVRAMLERLASIGVTKVVGVCMGVPGIVDAATRRVVYAPNLGWLDVEPVPFFAAVFGENVPIHVDNDANLQALAAAAAREKDVGWPQSFLYLTGDVGIGGSLIVDGLPDTGPHGWAGEVGHMTIEPDGPQCHCGSSGCLERYAGKQAILAAAGLPASASSLMLLQALDNGEPGVAHAVEHAGWALGIAIANVVNLLDLDTVVLGTSLAPLVESLRPAIVGQLDRRIIGRSSADITLLAAPDDPYPTSKGGALMSLREVFSSSVSTSAALSQIP